MDNLAFNFVDAVTKMLPQKDMEEMASLDTSIWSKVGECHKGQRIYNGSFDLATESQLLKNRWLQKMNLNISSIEQLQELIEVFKTKFWLTKNLDFTAECSFTLADLETLGFQETNLKEWPKTLVIKSQKNYKAIQIWASEGKSWALQLRFIYGVPKY
ncbi:hypothetical protein L596_016784 [Steinernema carpocapsae]|uniref:Uncharacterized protein n=1 Tax=Steinernema carpocapsae TaxID=34508 RepID=A0A4U5NIX5_STECR|nr:hypothetical protein L596_016784 [Steinernema carpocapsae]